MTTHADRLHCDRCETRDGCPVLARIADFEIEVEMLRKDRENMLRERGEAKAALEAAREERRAAIVENAVRWCQNILVEVQANHAEHITPNERRCLRTAISHLTEYHLAGRRPTTEEG